MRIIDFSGAAENFDKILDRVVADREPALILRHEAEAVVLVAASDWEVMQRRISLNPRSSAS